MKALYENISNKIENSTFSYSDYKVDGDGFSILPISIYSLVVDYKGSAICVENELGNHNIGKVELLLEGKRLPEFRITNTNHFVNIFLRRKIILKVECKNNLFKKFLEQKLTETGLEKLAKDNLFEPEIFNLFERNKMKIVTKYHLQFEDKTGVIKPLISFYKSLIDY